ncbi:hypothetical protein D3C80_1613450 [compost metagenome]
MLHRTDQRGSPLELLQSQQAQGVAHDYSQTARRVVAAHISLQAANRHGESSDTKICLSLATTGGEPKQVSIGL